MAVNATAVYRVRVGGSNTNGGGYDPAISGAGTDYSQQDAAELSLTDIACSNTTTVTSATGGFTSAMIGNAIWITGGGASAGPYFITARTNTNTITVDRTPGTVSAGSGAVGGAWASPTTNWNNTWMVPGVTMYIRGSGTDYPTSIDYTPSGSVSPLGNSTNMVRIIGEYGRPMLEGTGTRTFVAGFTEFCNLVVRYTAATTNPVIGSSSSQTVRVFNCAFDQNGYDSVLIGIAGGWSGDIIGCEFFSSVAKRTTNANYGLNLVVTSNEASYMVRKCFIHDLIGPAIYMHTTIHITDCIIVNNGGVGIYSNSSIINVQGGVFNCTLSGNAGAANIDLGHNTVLVRTTIWDCIIANHATAGIKFSGGMTSTQATRWASSTIQNNLFYNNGAHASGFTLASSNTTGTDPGFVDATNGNFTPQTDLAGTIVSPMAGQSLGSPKVPSVTYAYPGAIQPDAPAGTTVINVNRTYYLEQGHAA